MPDLATARREAEEALRDHESRWPPYCACCCCCALRALLAASPEPVTALPEAVRGAAEKVCALAEHHEDPQGNEFIVLWGADGIGAITTLRLALSALGSAR